MEARAGGRLAGEEAEGDWPPSHRFQTRTSVSGPNIARRWEIPMKLAPLPPEPGSGCGGRWQAAKKAAPRKLEAAEKKAAPKKK